MGLAKKVLLRIRLVRFMKNIAAMDGMSVVTAWLGCLAYTSGFISISAVIRHGSRTWKDVRFEFMQNFQLSVYFKKRYRVLEKMAYFAGIMVLCIFRLEEQGNGSAAYTESSDRMVPDRSLARGKLELCGMGALLRSNRKYFTGKILAALPGAVRHFTQ